MESVSSLACIDNCHIYLDNCLSDCELNANAFKLVPYRMFFSLIFVLLLMAGFPFVAVGVNLCCLPKCGIQCTFVVLSMLSSAANSMLTTLFDLLIVFCPLLICPCYAVFFTISYSLFVQVMEVMSGVIAVSLTVLIIEQHDYV